MKLKSPRTPGEAEKASRSAPSGGYAEGHPSPAAAKILSEKGIASESIKGSGVDGRITKADALKADKRPVEKTDGPKFSETHLPARFQVGETGEDEYPSEDHFETTRCGEKRNGYAHHFQ